MNSVALVYVGRGVSVVVKKQFRSKQQIWSKYWGSRECANKG